MKESKKQYTVKTYTVKKDFRVDVITYKGMYEAWLYQKGYGVKTLMFGFPIIQHNIDGTPYTISYDEFLQMVENNVADYIPDYLENLDILESALNEKFYR